MVRLGIDGLGKTLQGLNFLPIWTVGIILTAPIAVGIADVVPPWPKGIVLITVVVDAVVLLYVLHVSPRFSREHQNRLTLFLTILLAISSLTYLFMFTRLTFVIPTTGIREIKGFLCTAEAKLVFGTKCPNVDLESLSSAEYEAAKIWEPWSIDVVRLMLVTCWLLPFGSLSFLVGCLQGIPKTQSLSRIPPPYTGDESYLFISYSRADMSRIAPILQHIQSQRYLVWYDKAIPGGAEWDAEIARRIRNCTLFVVLISKDAIDSKWVKREIKFADQMNKPILGIRLDEAVLSEGLDITLMQYQMVDANSENFSQELDRALQHLQPR